MMLLICPGNSYLSKEQLEGNVILFSGCVLGGKKNVYFSEDFFFNCGKIFHLNFTSYFL